MLRKWIMILLSSSLCIFPVNSIEEPLKLTEQKEEEILIDYNFNESLTKIAQETKRISEEVLETNEEKIFDKTEIDFKFLCTYYGNTANECGKANQPMANGEEPYYLAVAAPKEIPFGSEITINNKTFIVCDRGNEDYIKMLDDNYARIDIFIPRYDNENDYQYEKRVNSYGTDIIEGKLKINR